MDTHEETRLARLSFEHRVLLLELCDDHLCTCIELLEVYKQIEGVYDERVAVTLFLIHCQVRCECDFKETTESRTVIKLL